ncbi:hypothetical protein EW146_g8968 [Bondarzewia mesenterica]|uniref:Zn(2)-C6 fungal-type domain-containing protein n=1 Tax=Bondarzewia mesenterica TaxID=1095465 RepID=A0A4S4L9X9_9AGAM|nr:hypothetical protein EW146_g8968 [Bondarzewia mesenterica]
MPFLLEPLEPLTVRFARLIDRVKQELADAPTWKDAWLRVASPDLHYRLFIAELRKLGMFPDNAEGRPVDSTDADLGTSMPPPHGHSEEAGKIQDSGKTAAEPARTTGLKRARTTEVRVDRGGVVTRSKITAEFTSTLSQLNADELWLPGRDKSAVDTSKASIPDPPSTQPSKMRPTRGKRVKLARTPPSGAHGNTEVPPAQTQVGSLPRPAHSSPIAYTGSSRSQTEKPKEPISDKVSEVHSSESTARLKRPWLHKEAGGSQSRCGRCASKDIQCQVRVQGGACVSCQKRKARCSLSKVMQTRRKPGKASPSDTPGKGEGRAGARKIEAEGDGPKGEPRRDETGSKGEGKPIDVAVAKEGGKTDDAWELDADEMEELMKDSAKRRAGVGSRRARRS